ncbi:MAG: 50S ribosomal protein L3 [Elusimicrobiota bacterium]
MAQETKQTQTPGLKVILAKKVGMTQFFSADGLAHGATVLKAGPCYVTQVKTKQTDGYDAIQLGFDQRKPKNVDKASMGRFEKAKTQPLTYLREVRDIDPAAFALGMQVDVGGMFVPGDYIDVHGTSKGKGFAGGVKRWNFRGGPATHGQSDRHRAPGSLAGRRSLGRVLPGKKMAGHLGVESVTMQKIEVLKVDPEQHLLYINGPVPGPAGAYVYVESTVKRRKKKLVVEISHKAKKKLAAKAASAPAAAKK